MGLHGFARNKAFRIKQRPENRIVLFFADDEETYKQYPFRFRLEVEYCLPQKKKEIQVKWIVYNDSVEKNMYFSIGGHPGFVYQVEDKKQNAVCLLDKQGSKWVQRQEIETGLLGEDGLLTGEKEKVLVTSGRFSALDAIVKYKTVLIQDEQVRGLALCDSNGNHYIKVMSDAPVWGIWSVEDEKANYVCLEPWYGICDEYGYTGEFARRPYTMCIAPEEKWEGGYTNCVV